MLWNERIEVLGRELHEQTSLAMRVKLNVEMPGLSRHRPCH